MLAMNKSPAVSSPDVGGARRRNRRGRRSREEILQAASKIMSARGFAAASLSDLQRETGLPSSVIYYYFGSKAGLLSAVMEWGTEQFFDDVPPVPESTADDASPRQLLSGYIRGVHEVRVRHEEFLRLLLILLLTDDAPEAVDAVRRVRIRGRTEIHALIAKAFSRYGDAAAKSVADALADFVFAAFEGAFLSKMGEGEQPYHRLMEQVADAISTLGEAHISQIGADSPCGG